MSDNPFAEPEDSDRTVVRGPGGPRPVPPRPAPGGSTGAPPAGSGGLPFAAAAPDGFGAPPERPAGPARPGAGARAAEAAPRLAGEAEALPRVGPSPLAACAAPLLDLLGRRPPPRAAATPQPPARHARCRRGLGQFEADAREAGVPAEQIRAAHYALCAALDDVVLATPWGAQSGWGARTLVASFHKEVRSGDRFFDLLAGMQKDPGRYLQALEVAYLCLALGFQGRYRLAPRGAAELDRHREGLYQLLAQMRGPWERELSPRWKGVDAPHRPARRGVPAWVGLAAAACVLGLGWVGLSERLNAASDDLFARVVALPPAALPEIVRAAPPQPPAPPPPPPAPPRPTALDKLRQFLAPEIAQGLVTVSGDAQRVLVRIRNRGMFASGSATVDERFVGLLERIGQALQDEPGRVRVIGHSDNQPIRSARFPSNYHLSAARAEAAKAIIVRAEGQDPARFAAEGRGEAEPIASNATPEGREENRRIEVLLLRGVF
ncbi:type VI secretion system protein TssL, long form [Caldovatus aquaticus]|uniref:Type VI secretion system protein TssL, long form n=1 Tax=Caldovatus aquaticus TaxID=2865671 RepID=A0ABS7F3P4_9PROT|nr:type VI secretion system protein TssL, long form [Caldovatus aquaticus]MBW8270230.1 type VI secretion system protein TssL, long form [Caldovatus aquaticus]